MEKFIPYNKLSKKKQKELDRAKRNTWGSLNPVSRVKENGKKYKRSKAHDWSDDPACVFFCSTWNKIKDRQDTLPVTVAES